MSKYLPLLRGCAAAALGAAVSVAAVAPAEACEVPVVIDAPTTLNDPVECITILNAMIEGDVVNNTTIDNITPWIGQFEAVRVENSTISGQFINNGVVRTDFSGAVLLLNSDIAGGIVNNGTIFSSGNGAIMIGGWDGVSNVASVQTGAIENYGTISGPDGLSIEAGSSFLNTLTNYQAGVIHGGTDGLSLGPDSTWNGGIINHGEISGGSRAGISLDGDFSGGILNTGTISADGNDTVVGIWLQSGTFNGGIVNHGTIIGASYGIRNFGTLNGGILNTGTILAEEVGIRSDGLSGGIVNSGMIVGTTETGLIAGGDTTGGLVNSGTISGAVRGMQAVINFEGGITNSGEISGGDDGLQVLATFTGSILNTQTGVISGDRLYGILVGGNLNSDVTGAIVNDGQITGGVTAVFIGGGVFNGGIRNTGVMSGASEAGIFLSGSTFSGGIVNSATGEIFGNVLPGIYIEYSNFSGGIDNAGHIASTAGKGIFVNYPDTSFTSFSGNIVNRAGGLIEGQIGGVEMRSNWLGDFLNAGTIQTTNGDGVFINNSQGVWNGDAVNDGLIQGGTGEILDIAALHFEFAEWNGGVLNRGTITGPAAGVLAGVDVWNGDFDNRGTISGAAGVGIGSNAFTGNILNSATGVMQGQAFGLGLCNADCQESGEGQTGVDFVGALLNSGDILKTSTALDQGFALGAVTIFANSWTGDIVNEAGGLISSPTLAVAMTKQNAFFGEGFDPLPVVFFTGNFINRGTILGGVDLRIADWTGNFDNSGSIAGGGIAAFKFVGGIEGLLLNSGAITGSTALDLSGVTTAATYRQTGAASQTSGDILLSDTAATMLDFRGGSLAGGVLGSGLDDRFEVNAGAGAFAYLEGVLSDMDAFAVNSGTASIGASALGQNGAGVTMANAGALSVGAGATLYLDDNTSITATSATFTPTSTFAALLTPNTAVHPSIAVSGSASLAGSFVAHIDWRDFLRTRERRFVYDGVISGPVTGTFSSVTIADAPRLFRISAIYNSVDIVIERAPFTTLADPASPNQGSVTGAIEEIFQEGTSDPDLLNLVDSLVEVSETGDILDAIAGSTQAETDLAALKSDDPWKQSVAQRVDAARSTGCTITGDTWCRTRYAQAPAAPVQTDAGEDPDAFAWLDTGLRDVGATSVWGRLVGIWGESDGGVSSPASNQRTYAVIAGADHVVDGTLLVGLAGQYVRTKADFDGSENESSVESLQAGAYFSYGGAETYLNGNVSAIATHASTKRIFSVGAIDYLAHVRYPSTSVTGSLELGTIFEVGGGYRLEPHAGLNFVGQFTDAYAEHGAGGLGLIVDPDDVHSLRSLIGARASRVYELGDRRIVPELRLEWRHEYLDRNTTFLAAFQGAPDVTFLVACEPTARDVVVVGGGLTLPVSGRITGYLDAEGAFSEDTRAGTLSLGARATW